MEAQVNAGRKIEGGGSGPRQVIQSRLDGPGRAGTGREVPPNGNPGLDEESQKSSSEVGREKPAPPTQYAHATAGEEGEGRTGQLGVSQTERGKNKREIRGIFALNSTLGGFGACSAYLKDRVKPSES